MKLSNFLDIFLSRSWFFIYVLYVVWF